MNWSGEERRQHQPITREDLTEVVGLALERHVHSDSHQFVETLMGKENVDKNCGRESRGMSLVGEQWQ